MLIPCPACGREISVAAEACPQCGHPNRPPARPPTPADGPTCYSCDAPATTRCQACGKLSCALHVNSIYVSHGKGGANELRCEGCYKSAELWKAWGVVIAVVAIVVMLIIWGTVFKGFGR